MVLIHCLYHLLVHRDDPEDPPVLEYRYLPAALGDHDPEGFCLLSDSGGPMRAGFRGPGE